MYFTVTNFCVEILEEIISLLNPLSDLARIFIMIYIAIKLPKLITILEEKN